MAAVAILGITFGMGATASPAAAYYGCGWDIQNYASGYKSIFYRNCSTTSAAFASVNVIRTESNGYSYTYTKTVCVPPNFSSYSPVPKWIASDWVSGQRSEEVSPGWVEWKMGYGYC